MKQLQFSSSVYDLVQANPKALELLISLGFTPLANPVSLNTVGKVTSIEKALDFLKFDKDIFIEKFKEIGVDII